MPLSVQSPDELDFAHDNGLFNVFAQRELSEPIRVFEHRYFSMICEKYPSILPFDEKGTIKMCKVELRATSRYRAL